MSELMIISEGPTELAFVRDVLSEHLATQGISAWPVLPGKSRRRGGVRNWEGAREDIVRALKGRRYCSTMIDYYAMPDDWPGRLTSNTVRWQDRAAHVEMEIANDVSSTLGSRFDPKYFIPYVQLHEFEALTFSDVDILAGVVAPVCQVSKDTLSAYFSKVLEECGHPEAINDSWETCPSRRITKIARAYSKSIHGPIITRRTGLETIRQKCNHFDRWLKPLEQLPSN